MVWAFRAGISTLRFNTGLCKINQNLSKIQVAWLSNYEIRKMRPPRPAPFPYWEKKYTAWYQFIDTTLFRFDDNTKVIVVDGPPAIGKGELCKQLAKEFDMLYVPQATVEDWIIHYRDFDMRTLNDKVPASCRVVDLETFFQNPTLRSGALVQNYFYKMRYYKFIDCLAHILSTGQGIITERGPWSDACFAKAMHSNGYLSNEAYHMHKTMVEQSLHELLRPHLIIYLDVPVKEVQDNIKKRNYPAEANTKVLSEKFLTDLENNHKYEYLKDMSKHCHVLVYDYSQGGDFGLIAGDLETLDFDDIKYMDDLKFSDWDYESEWRWADYRATYCNGKDDLCLNWITDGTIPEELMVTAGELEEYHQALIKHAHRRVWDPSYCPLKEKKKKTLITPA